jgi:hypothetical protein
MCRGYSAHEHTVLFSNVRLSTSSALPQDIIVEVLVAVVIVSVGLVLGAEKLKPISWRDWAGEIERNGGARNPYLSLEERHGFWDIRVRYGLPLLILPFFPSVSSFLFWQWRMEQTKYYSIKIDANPSPLDRLSGRSLRIGSGKRMWRTSSDYGTRGIIMLEITVASHFCIIDISIAEPQSILSALGACLC